MSDRSSAHTNKSVQSLSPTALECQAIMDKLLASRSDCAQSPLISQTHRLSERGVFPTPQPSDQSSVDAPRSKQIFAPATIGDFVLPTSFPPTLSSGNSRAPAKQPEFVDRAASVVTAIAAWPERLPLLDERDEEFVDDYASAQTAPGYGEAMLHDHAQVTGTYLVNAYGADLYDVVTESPRFAHVSLLPSMQRHVEDLRQDHKERSEKATNKIYEESIETERKCIETVRQELGLMMSGP